MARQIGVGLFACLFWLGVHAVEVHPEAVSLIVRWEVSSPAAYERRYRGVIWPGGASGPTWGVGYDGGHQPPHLIAEDWAAHPSVDRLVQTSGVRGQRAKAELWRWHGIETDFVYAYRVFAERTLVEYDNRARRAFRRGWNELPKRTQGALVSLVYNRGASMTGDHRREMRTLRDVCVPTGDVWCIGREIRAMCRLWAGTPNYAGLCARRNDEARLAERAE